MTVKHGFELIREEEIEERNTTARLYRHLKSGAELLSLENDDENKSFGIAFRTPPEDSTGLPHIMEHSVLGGSKKYPLKEPFVELVKGSMKTFLNAFTSADMTAYPVASTNTQDFYNLVDVYLDAVLNPLITPNHLAQEGWHLELEKVEDPLIYKGVVFNEMKGAYSSPEGVLYRHIKGAMFPDNAYRNDSGGDPEVMPNLTYEQFRTFHETNYHPTNSRIVFYGDDDPDRRLALADSYLREFDRAEVDTAVPVHAPFEKPHPRHLPLLGRGRRRQQPKTLRHRQLGAAANRRRHGDTARPERAELHPAGHRRFPPAQNPGRFRPGRRRDRRRLLQPDAPGHLFRGHEGGEGRKH
jgi:Zn-dependent M16 (insulinase) family peptidase